MKKLIILSTVMMTFSLSCKNTSSNNISPIAKAYIDEVISLLENKSVNKKDINWEVFKTKIYHSAKNSKTIEETYPSIFLAIEALKDKHSYFEPIINLNKEENKNPLPILKDEVVPNDIGYIRIPYCMGSEENNQNYIQILSKKISKQNQTNIKGWIVDLRDNFGGNMWPMLVSVEPILGSDTVGYFLDSDTNYHSWKLFKGKAYLNNTIAAETENLIVLKNKSPYVAVLINNKTASSGEAISVAFKGRNKTRFFGENTYGVSTGCKSYTLSDGSSINLAESVFIDRNKNKYGKSILPDVKCNEIEVLEKAVSWIYSMNIYN